MAGQTDESLEAGPEQRLYAAFLEKGMFVGLACLLVSFAIYVTGLVNPHIPPNELARYWGKGVEEYLQEANVKAGWAWVSMLGHGDFLNFVGIAILAGITILCYVVLVPVLLKAKDRTYAVLAILEVIVLAAAASGLLTAAD